MPGFFDYTAEAALNHALGVIPLVVANSNRFMALWTTPPTGDSGSGATEVSGGSYARLQIAGAVAATAAFTTSSPNITMTTNPGWVVPGMNVYDMTNGQQIGTVSTYTGTALVLTANAAHASSGSTDSLQFSAFAPAAASSGTEPAVTPCSCTLGAAIQFAQSSAAWGTIPAFGIFDASSSGNGYVWDYFNLSGAGKWSPCTITSASPGVITCDDQTFTNGNTVLFSTKIAGALPSLSSGSWAGLQTVAGVSGQTFNVSLNTTSVGDALVRPVTAIVIGATPTTLQFAASSIVVYGA